MKSHYSSNRPQIIVSPEELDHANNPSPRLPVAIVCDTSASMIGEPLAALRHGLQGLFSEIVADPLAQLRCDPSVWTFGGSVNQVMPWENEMVGRTPIPELVASGNTPLGLAVTTANTAIKARQRVYQASAIPSYRPWFVLFSDGAPTDLWHHAAHDLRRQVTEHGWNIVSVGVGPNADLECLRAFSPDRPPLHIRDSSSTQSFAEFFRWLSVGIRGTSRSATSQQPAMPPLPSCIDIA